MTHVSQKTLPPNLLEQLFDTLVEIFGKAENKHNLISVMDEMLTSIEKTMLAKRLAIILMLNDSIPQHRIVEMLKVSPTTVAKISLEIDTGTYDAIIKISKKKSVNVEKIIWDFLTVGGLMPPKAGQRYWRKHIKSKS